MGNFLDYTSRLRSYIPDLSPEQAEDYVNQAWRNIRESNDSWSFLWANEYWLAPASITLSGLGVVQHSDTVTLTHDNLVQLAGLSNPALTQRQLRFGLSGGPIYEIASCDVQQTDDGAITSATVDLTAPSGPFDSGMVGMLIRVAGAGASGADLDTTVAAYVSPTQVTLTDAAGSTVSGAVTTWGSAITMGRLYREDTNSSITALCYRLYYSPLSTDFQRIDHLVDEITGYEFGWQIMAGDVLDRMDPRRASVTQAYQVFYHKFDQSTGLPVFELWPAPTIQRAFHVYYWRLGTEFSAPSDALPVQVPEELLLLRARYLVYEWGMVYDPDFRRRQSYANALGYVRSRYSTEGQPGRPLGLLEQTKRRDREVYLKEFYRRPRNAMPGWPIDSNFLQRHDYSYNFGY